MNIKKNTKRIGVFVFYDKDGIVDDYVTFLLKSINDVLNKLIVVSNCYLKSEEKSKLLKYADIIEVRNNVGLDAGAFKYIYDKYKNEFDDYDELVLLNDTFFGPFKPFKEIFKEMSNKYVDFWGLSGHYDAVDGYGFLPDNIIHAHLQTFFMVFRKSVFNSTAFHDYWDSYDINKMKSFVDVVTKHELYFTYYLEQNGFIWDTYTDLTDYKSDDIAGNFTVYAYCAYDLIKNNKCPFIKRKNFVFNKRDAIFLNDGTDTRRALNYIKEKNLYDINLIYKNINRIYSAEDIYYGLNLSYVISESKNCKSSYAIIFYLNEIVSADILKKSLQNLNKENIYIYTCNDELNNLLSKEFNINVNINFAEKYDYLFVANDYRGISTKIIVPYKDMLYSVIENGIASQEYINGVIDFFNQNNVIDLLLLPECLHSEYFYDFLNMEKKVNFLNNACWMRSDLFKYYDKNDYYFIETLINKLNNNNKLFAKISNSNFAGSRMLIQESIINETYKKINSYMNSNLRTYPELLSSLIPSSPNIIQKLSKNKFLKLIYNFLRKMYHRIKKNN